MNYYENIIEYYDELFPVAPGTVDFIEALAQQIKSRTAFPGMVRILDIECATGVLDQQLVAHDFDVTGFDSSPGMLESAIRRKKIPYTNSRFLEMSMLDMGRYLCKNSFHIVLCLENRIAAIDDPVLLRQCFNDISQILTSGGCAVLELLNFEKIIAEKISKLPVRSSVRISFLQTLHPAAGGLMELSGKLDSGDSGRIHIPDCMLQYPLTTGMLDTIAAETGFAPVEYFGDYKKTPFTGDELSFIAVLQKK